MTWQESKKQPYRMFALKFQRLDCPFGFLECFDLVMWGGSRL